MLNWASGTLFKFTDVPTAGTELAETDAGKRQTFGSGKRRAARVEGAEIKCMYMSCGAGG